MKKLLLSISLIFALTSFTQTQTVYVCVSNTAVAYHLDKDCKGLSRCTHQIITTTKQDAIDKYKRKACRFCCK